MLEVDFVPSDGEVLFLEGLVDILDFEVDHVLEHIKGDRARLFFVVPVGVHSDINLGGLSSIGQNLGDDFRLIVHVLSVHLTADGVDLSDLGHELLESLVDLPELLDPLLIIELGLHLRLELLLSLATFLGKSSLLVPHLLSKLLLLGLETLLNFFS